MPFVSLTRLRLRSIRFLPGFFFHAVRSQRQLRLAPGFLGGGLLSDSRRTFWTMSLWDHEASMRAFMTSGAHRAAMPRLMEWCDEASVAHWEREERGLPSWQEAEQRMRQMGRPSRLRHPSPAHASMSYDPPATHAGVAITPAARD
jgi:hypothetical protein